MYIHVFNLFEDINPSPTPTVPSGGRSNTKGEISLPSFQLTQCMRLICLKTTIQALLLLVEVTLVKVSI